MLDVVAPGWVDPVDTGEEEFAEQPAITRTTQTASPATWTDPGLACGSVVIRRIVGRWTDVGITRGG